MNCSKTAIIFKDEEFDFESARDLVVFDLEQTAPCFWRLVLLVVVGAIYVLRLFEEVLGQSALFEEVVELLALIELLLVLVTVAVSEFLAGAIDEFAVFELIDLLLVMEVYQLFERVDFDFFDELRV